MGKPRIEALGFPKLRHQAASTSLEFIFGQLEHHGITKNMHLKRWLHSLLTEQQLTWVNMQG